MHYDSASMEVEFIMFQRALNTVRQFLICRAESYSASTNEATNYGATITSLLGIILWLL